MTSSPTSAAYRLSGWTLALLVLAAAGVLVLFDKAVVFMIGQWGMDEFSHGYLIPFIALFLVWQRRVELRQLEFRGSWAGLVVVVLGIALEAVGRLSSLFVLQHLALLVVIAGLVLSLVGGRAMRILAAPLAVLIFMVPLPNILLNTLSSQLQLISSSLGVYLIRLAGVSVFLEGNVVDLGGYKLEVAEACSGLRYLLPLMTLSFLMACFYKAPVWKRVVVFLSSIPITLIMNSARIAVIGVMVDRWGMGMAEGFLHEVQGWMIFMLSTLALLLEVRLLTRMGGERRPWREIFGLELPAPLPRSTLLRVRPLSAPLLASSAMLFVSAAFVVAMPERSMAAPARETFATFPLQLSGWAGRRETMDQIYLDTLKLDDYLLADYSHGGSGPGPVNLYVAWYDSQSAGEATHSPRGCLPGGGWRIVDMRQTPVGGVTVGTQPLQVNRALIEYGDRRQLVYYWFQQRGRVVTNEYLVKWYLLVDSLRRHRSDGALVRLIVPLPTGMPAELGDQELQGFAAAVAARLSRFVPG